MDLNQIGFTIALASIVFLFYLVYYMFSSNTSNENKKKEEYVDLKANTQKQEQQQSTKQQPKPKVLNKNQKLKDFVFKHEWLASTLKSHSDSVNSIDFSPNGKYLLSCGSDRAIFLWFTKEFDQAQHKSVRCNVEFDHATKIRFSPDSKSFITALGVGNTIRAFKMVKKDDNSIHMVQASIADFEKKHKADIINIGISCNGKFIMTCGKDTTIIIWDIKGDVLGTIDTRLMNNSYAAVSLCGRFFGACGFTPDCKVWEVCFDKTGNFREIKRAFELKGHSAGIYHFCFNSDSTRMASVSKDRTWKLWNTNVDYERGQDPTIIITGQLDTIGHSLIALSPDSYSIAVSIENKLCFYNTLNAKCDISIENVCVDSIVELQYSTDNKYLAVAGDRHIKIFHNITGFKVAIDDCTDKVKSAKSESTRERLQQTINEYKELIQKIENKN